ncbi:MAG: hypothetical protein GC180_06080 [Bacteroidetes bacterium]|nr:hypothetical protein [Bacteroidota bacterium]
MEEKQIFLLFLNLPLGTAYVPNPTCMTKKRSILFLTALISTLFYQSGSQTCAQADTMPQFLDTFMYEDIFSLNFDEDVTTQLLPLDTLVQIAFDYSPTLRFHYGEVGAARAQVTLAKRSWHSYISTYASASYGSQNIALYTYNPNTGGNQTQASNGYTMGATVALPLSIFTQTPVKVEMMRQELSKFEARVDEAKLKLKREVAAEYFMLVTSQRLLKIISEDVQSATLALNVAEIQFANGTIPPYEFSRVKNLQTIARTNYEVRFREFATTYFQFEALLGVEMYQLKRNNHP